MAAKKKTPAPAGFAGALLKAGIVSEADAEKAAIEKRAQDEAARRAKMLAAFDRGAPKDIAALFTSGASNAETFEQAIDRGNAWLAAMLEKGHGPKFGNVLERCKNCVERVGNPVSNDEVDAIEKAFGFGFPKSYRRFLTTIGQVRFLNPWGDETVAAHELVEQTKTFEYEIGRLAKIVPGSGQCVYVCDFHNHSAHYFLSCAERDAKDESPVHLIFHDESEPYDGISDFEVWFAEKVTHTIEEQTTRLER